MGASVFEGIPAQVMSCRWAKAIASAREETPSLEKTLRGWT